MMCGGGAAVSRRSAQRPCTIVGFLVFSSLVLVAAEEAQDIGRRHREAKYVPLSEEHLPGKYHRRLMESGSSTSHRGPLLAREVPRLANKQAQVEARFAARREPRQADNKTMYADDPDITPSSARVSVILYWDRNFKGNPQVRKALQAWDKFFKNRVKERTTFFTYKSLDYNKYEPSDVAVVYSSYNRHKVTPSPTQTQSQHANILLVRACPNVKSSKSSSLLPTQSSIMSACYLALRSCIFRWMI